VNAAYASMLAADRWPGALTAEEESLHAHSFAQLTRGQFKQLLAIGERVALPRGTELTREHEPCDYLYFVVSGSAKLYLMSTYAADIEAGGFVNDVAFQQGDGAGAYGSVLVSSAGRSHSARISPRASSSAQCPLTAQRCVCAAGEQHRLRRHRVAARRARRVSALAARHGAQSQPCPRGDTGEAPRLTECRTLTTASVPAHTVPALSTACVHCSHCGMCAVCCYLIWQVKGLLMQREAALAHAKSSQVKSGAAAHEGEQTHTPQERERQQQQAATAETPSNRRSTSRLRMTTSELHIKEEPLARRCLLGGTVVDSVRGGVGSAGRS
jgi:hypothetical protein